MTKNQKQLCISLPVTIVSFLAMYLTHPLLWVGLVCILPFIGCLFWTIGLGLEMISQSGLGKWLSEDDK